MPQIVLGVTNASLTSTLSHPLHGPGDVEVKGFVVCLQKKLINQMSQQWKFTSDGNIVNQVNLFFSHS